jgi:hypothetical protein
LLVSFKGPATGPASAQRSWRWGWRLSLVVALLALASLLPYAGSSSELVHLRNALLFNPSQDAGRAWTPENLPEGFLQEHLKPDPVFVAAAARLGFAEIPGDWERALAIGQHLLGSSPVLLGGAIQSDLDSTYRRIIQQGDGYCGDFVRAFTGLALASGLQTRSWAFSFDGFGGHGHVWVELWNRQTQSWQLLDVFDNYYFVLGDERPLSALEFRAALAEQRPGLALRPIAPSARPGYEIEAKAWDYFRRGLPEWYLWWGVNVFSYDAEPWVQRLGKVSRSLEQLAAIATGVHPQLVILASADNRPQAQALQRLQIQLKAVALIVLLMLVSALVCLLFDWRHRRRPDPHV